MTAKQDWIKSQLPNYPNMVAYEIAGELNQEYWTENPEPITKVPKPITVEEVSALLPPAARFKVQQTATWKFILDDALRGDYRYFVSNLENLRAGKTPFGEEILSQEEYEKILKLLQETINDPSYQPEIFTSLAKAAGFDFIYTNDVEECLV